MWPIPSRQLPLHNPDDALIALSWNYLVIALMISVNQLTVEFGGTALFRDITLLVSPKDRIGLVGKNGAGKSTLLKIMAGLQQPTSGGVVLPSGARVGYLPQQMAHVGGKSVIEEARMAFDEVLSLEREMHRLSEEISLRTDYESSDYMDQVHRLSEVTDHFHLLGGMNLDAEAEKTLLGLGFRHSDFSRATTEFSGGWRMRIELAKVLLRQPDVLLLDEPTNHLDIESITWLEAFLSDYSGAVILVSHDRAFLDNVTRRTVELSLGSLTDYKVPYSEYVALRAERRSQQMAAYKNQQKMLQDTRDFIERFRYKATKSVQVQSRIKQLEKIDIIEVDEEDHSAIHIAFPPAPRCGAIPVEAASLVKQFGEKVILRGVDIEILRGEKVAFVGRNGEGKTTFSRVIVGDLPFESGRLKLGHNVRIGYFAQNQDEIMDESLTVFETLDAIATGDIRNRLRDLLGAFLFRGGDVDKKVSVLSGGERSRLAILKLLLEPYNVLVLDEPTNHLDMRSKSLLKEALLRFDGTLILVSHDRDFLDGLVTKVYEFREGSIFSHIGGIYDFLRRRKIETLNDLQQKPEAGSREEALVLSVDKSPSSGKQDYLEKKEAEKKLRKVVSMVQKSELAIATLEQQIEEIRIALSDPERYSDQLAQKHAEQESALLHEMHKWEQLLAEQEALSQT
ncbi:MAG: ABC-F family ATP-binding cassette domain-containing protein [Bacteroidales bacterium]